MTTTTTHRHVFFDDELEWCCGCGERALAVLGEDGDLELVMLLRDEAVVVQRATA